MPGEPIIGQIERPSAAHAIDVLRIRATPRTPAAFNNPNRLKKTLRDDLAHYDLIIMTLAPILQIGERQTNSVSLARAADAAFLVCTAEQTTVSEAQEAVAAFKDADVNLAEIIMDNSNIVPPGPEMAAFVEKYLPLPGTLRQRLAIFLRRSEYFNDRAREQDRDGA
jgi:Mrp family chromosome partitioning ATPase